MAEVYSFPDERRSVLMTRELREVREVNVLSSMSSLFFLRPKGRGWRTKGPVPVTGMDGEGQRHQAPGPYLPLLQRPSCGSLSSRQYSWKRGVDGCQPPSAVPSPDRAVGGQGESESASTDPGRAAWGTCSWHWARALGLLQSRTGVNIRGGPSCSHLVFITANSFRMSRMGALGRWSAHRGAAGWMFQRVSTGHVFIQ